MTSRNVVAGMVRNAFCYDCLFFVLAPKPKTKDETTKQLEPVSLTNNKSETETKQTGPAKN